jgi:EmrB/QacA subfamily drug resistance transporter
MEEAIVPDLTTASERAQDRPARASWVLLVVGGGTLLTAASSSTVNLALPELSHELHVPLELTSWVVTSFLLTTTVLLLVAGRLGDVLGHARVYLAGFALFGLASLGCGLAPGIGGLIAGRIAQGVGSAMVAATGPALLTTTFPGAQRGRALGLLSTATYTGLTVGPPIGGWVVGILSWRWVFLVNLPVAALVIALGIAVLPSSRGRSEKAFDWPGMLSSILGLPLLLFALTQGRRLGWSSPLVLGAGACGLGLLAAFVWIERRQPHPLLDLRLFRSRIFSGATLSAFGNYVALFVPTILLPFYVVEALGIEPARAGIVLSAQPLVMAIVASPAGRLSDRWGSRGLATVGMLVLALGLGGLSFVGPGASVGQVMAWCAVIGLGTGVFISPNSSALMGAAPRSQQGVAGGVMAVARSLGMMTGVAAASAIFVAAGGRTGHAWQAADYHALRGRPRPERATA